MNVMWRRFGAHWIDFIIYNGVGYLISEGIQRVLYFFMRLSAWTTVEYDKAFHPYFSLTLDTVVTLGFGYIYYVLPQVKTGQTVGKKICGVKVIVEETGQLMNLKQSIIRFLGYGLSYITMGSGFLMAFFHPKKQALHDLPVGTITIRAGV